MIPEALRRFPYRIPALLYFALALACTQFPLLNYLGYEFSVVTALVASFVAGFLTIGAIKRSLQDASAPPSHHLAAFKRILLINLLVLIIPLVVIGTNALFVKNCSVAEGLVFFTMIPVVSVIFSSALGFFCAAHYRRARVMFTLVVLVTFAEVLAVGYFTPAIFSYNFFYGYFPGVTYDEILRISWSLVLFRILTLALAAVLVWMAMLLLQHTEPGAPVWEKGLTLPGVMVQGRNVFITAGVATLVIVTWWFRGELGFDSGSAFIQRQLGSRFETRHFIIYYSKEAYDEPAIRRVAAEHEFRLRQVADELHVFPKAKVESYIYPTAELKQRLMGAGTTNIAKPWSGQLHITKASLDATLKHELVHIVAAPFGLPIIKASLSTGLVEGVAMAIEWNWGNRTLHHYAAAMKKFGVGPDVAAIMSITGFAAHSSSVSYILAGSFCRFLIDRYGIRNMMRLYNSRDYVRVYDKTLGALVAEWQTYLGTIDVPEQERDVVDVLFRSPPIFGKVCARRVAARTAEARKLFGARAYVEAYARYKESYDETKSYESLAGMFSASLRLGRYREVTALFDSVIMRDKRPAQFLPLFLMAGDAYRMLGDSLRAAHLYRRVEIANIADWLTEGALIRLHCSFTDSTEWRNIFIRDDRDSVRFAILHQHTVHGNPFAAYLYGKTLLRSGRYTEAANLLNSLRFREISDRLELFRLTDNGIARFYAGEYDQARTTFWRSLNFVTSEAARNTALDWVSRCEWMTTYAGREH